MHSPPCAFSRREKDVPEAPFQRTLEAQSLTQVPFLVKLISPSKLGYLNDGSIMPSIHPLLRGYFAIATRFRLLPLRTRGVLALHPASWIDVQSLPRGCSFPMPIHWMRTCTSHHQISCVKGFPFTRPSRSIAASFGRTCRTPVPAIMVLPHLSCSAIKRRGRELAW